jgi:hypothetical protein
VFVTKEKVRADVPLDELVLQFRRSKKSDAVLGYHKYVLRVLKKSMDMYVKIFGEQEADSDNTLMTIGEFAKYCGVPKSTLRYYFKIKKLEPFSYTNSGYMLFTREQAELLNK